MEKIGVSYQIVYLREKGWLYVGYSHPFENINKCFLADGYIHR